MRDQAVFSQKKVKELMATLPQHAEILCQQVLLNVLKTGELPGICTNYDSALGRVVLMVVCGYFTPKSLAEMTELDKKLVETSLLVEARRELTNTTFELLQDKYAQDVADFNAHVEV